MSACTGDIPVLCCERILDGVEGDDAFEEGVHLVSFVGVGEVCERGVTTEIVSYMRMGEVRGEGGELTATT